MSRHLALVVLFLLCTLGSARRHASSSPPIALKNVSIINVKTGNISGGSTVIIRDGRIAAVGPARRIAVPGDAQIIDGRGRFLIPGLWDMHVHTILPGYLPLYLANGVTGVRDMGNYPAVIQGIRQQVALGAAVGPRIIAAGPIVDGPKPIWPFSIAVGNEAQGRQAVTSIKKQGFDFVKVYSLLPREAYFAIADEAKKQGIPFAGHVPFAVTAAEASNAGQKSMEHLLGISFACSTREQELSTQMNILLAGNANPFSQPDGLAKLDIEADENYDETKARALFALFVRNRTWQVPTLTVLRSIAFLDDPSFTSDPRIKYMPVIIRNFWDPSPSALPRDRAAQVFARRKKLFQRDLELVGAMNKAGVPILAGTDTTNPFVFPGFSLHDELELLVKAGLSPIEALRAATISPAIYLGLDREMGTIEEGKEADLVLLGANPLLDIGNTRKIEAVVCQGKLFRQTDLAAMLDKAVAAAQGK